MLLPLDAAADGDNPLGLRQVDRLLRFLERRLGFLPNRRRIDFHVHAANRRGRCAFHRPVRAKRADLKRDEVWSGALRHDVRRQLALKHRPDESRLAAGPFDAGHIGHERAVEARRELRCEVARLVGVRQRHEGRRELSDCLLQRLRVAVRGVRLEGGVLDRDDLFHLRRRELAGNAADTRSGHADDDRVA